MDRNLQHGEVAKAGEFNFKIEPIKIFVSDEE